jgi:hypothetical protein
LTLWVDDLYPILLQVGQDPSVDDEHVPQVRPQEDMIDPIRL